MSPPKKPIYYKAKPKGAVAPVAPADGEDPSVASPDGAAGGGAARRGKLSVPSTPGAAPDSLSAAVDDPVERLFFRRALLVVGAALAVMLFAFASVFFLAVRGAEKTQVPNIVGQELVDGLILLQEKDLFARLQVKYTDDPLQKGLIVSQDPSPGLSVKAGRRITVTVSRGSIAETVEDYVGQTLSQTRSRLASLFSTYTQLLTIREPITYVYDEAPAGTVLAQEPAPGTQLSQATELVLVVSRGPEDVSVLLPDFTGLSVRNVISMLSKMPQPFVFREDAGEATGREPSVRSQDPPSETEIRPGQKLVLYASRPAVVPRGLVYGMFDFTIPDFPVSVELEVWVREPGQTDRLFFSMPHPGGEVSFPYVVPAGTIYILKAGGEEMVRYEVQAPG